VLSVRLDRDVTVRCSGRHRRILYLRDAAAVPDVRAVADFFRMPVRGPPWPGGGHPWDQRTQTLDRDGSLAELDAGAVSLECGEGLEGVADRAAQPEVAGLGDDQDVPALDADLDRTNAIAERLADLSLDPTPGGGVGIFIRLAVGPGALSGWTAGLLARG